MTRTALVVTTIQAPSPILFELAAAAAERGADFIAMGDRKSPPGFVLEGCRYFDLKQQHAAFGTFSSALPEGHYVRKNLGYLAALESGADWIVETDDDNAPLPDFFDQALASRHCRELTQSGWINAYRYFTPSSPIWPRGYPLEKILQDESTLTATLPTGQRRARIVQGLADDNPDVDAIFRLTRALPVTFDRAASPLWLGPGSWCPFNSQNTWFARADVVLAYLPAYCSFRMTDIWRSFIAQRCLWAAGDGVIFIAPTVRQERNEHRLLKDFEDEVPGYLRNELICSTLAGLELGGEPAADIRSCYVALIQAGIFPPQELGLLDQWLDAVKARI